MAPPLFDDTLMLNPFHNDWLGRAPFVGLRRTNGEISEQRWLSIRALAIEILAHQVSRLLVCGKEKMMATNVPYFEKPIPSVKNRSAANFETVLRRRGGRNERYCRKKKSERIGSRT